MLLLDPFDHPTWWLRVGGNECFLYCNYTCCSHHCFPPPAVFSFSWAVNNLPVWFLRINLTLLLSRARGSLWLYMVHSYHKYIYICIMHNLYICEVLTTGVISRVFVERYLFVASCVLFIPFCSRRHQTWCQLLGSRTPRISTDIGTEVSLQLKIV